MKYHFYKYQGTGNDFIIFNGKMEPVKLNKDQIKKLCNRRFGIGADGVIILDNAQNSDFKMVYFNSDGNEGTMCGNGGRCIVQFASLQKYIDKATEFEAVDGRHQAQISTTDPIEVSLLMNDVDKLEIAQDFVYLDTGSPHLVTFVDDVESVDVVEEGLKIRNSKKFIEAGINVNFVEVMNNRLSIRTYERGVESETLSCGTGVTASVLAAVAKGFIKNNSECMVTTPGGHLKVKYLKSGTGFRQIYLIGPAVFVYEGEIEL